MASLHSSKSRPLINAIHSTMWVETENISDTDRSTPERSTPVLMLSHFTATPRLSFGQVKITSEITKAILIKNPNDFPQEVVVEKIPAKKGFSVESDSFIIAPLTEKTFAVIWCPVEKGSVREVLSFRIDSHMRKQVILLGSAIDDRKATRQKPLKELHLQNKQGKNTQKKKSHTDIRSFQKAGNRNLKYKSPKSKWSQESLVNKRKHSHLNSSSKKKESCDTNLNSLAMCTGRPVVSPIKLSSSERSGTDESDMTDLSVKNTGFVNAMCVHARYRSDKTFKINRSQFTRALQGVNKQLSETDPTFEVSSEQELSEQDIRRQTYITSPAEKHSSSEVIEKLFVNKNIELASCENFPETPERRQTYTKQSPLAKLDASKGINPGTFDLPFSPARKDLKVKSPTKNSVELSMFHGHASKTADGNLAKDNDSDRSQQENVFHRIDTSPEAVSGFKSLRSATGLTNETYVYDTHAKNESGKHDSFQLSHVNYSDFCKPLIEFDVDSLDGNELICEKEVLPIENIASSLDQEVENPALTHRCSTGQKSIPSTGNQVPKSVDSGRKLFLSVIVPSVTNSSDSSQTNTVPESHQVLNNSPPSIIAPTKRSSEESVSGSLSKRSCQRVDDIESKTGRMMKLLPQKLMMRPIKDDASLTRHPNPFAAKNMYYDELWAQKQTQGFISWLNFILTLPKEFVEAPHKHSRNTLSGPSRESLSLQLYSMGKRMNRLRYKACQLYQSDKLTSVLQRLEDEIENSRLIIRKDRAMHVDVGVREKLIGLLLNYNPLWLRLGIETVFGQILMLKSNANVEGISNFISKNLLNNSEIAKQYAHATVPHLYKPGFATALKKHTLKKFLVLVLFLDHAKQQRIINFDPCLFRLDATIKASRDILFTFSREYLSAEGDITKHLAFLGYRVSCQQTSLDEFDFSVKALPVDLRNGLRLARVLEMLIPDQQLLNRMRIPTISRLQKLHNVELIWSVLREYNCPVTTVTPKDVVDGHKEKTLFFLWQLILQLQVKVSCNIKTLQKEVHLLRRSLLVHGLKEWIDTHQLDKEISTERELQFLFQWCQLVCAHYEVSVCNFTTSFSDGRALCYIIHHYCPTMLPLKAIKMETTQTMLIDKRLSLHSSFGSDDSFNMTCDYSVEKSEKLLKNEERNLLLVTEKVLEIGGVPQMIKAENMSNTIPDEKVTVTFLSLLCARLLEISTEMRAARIIQLAWRRYYPQKISKKENFTAETNFNVSGIHPLAELHSTSKKTCAAHHHHLDRLDDLNEAHDILNRVEPKKESVFTSKNFRTQKQQQQEEARASVKVEMHRKATSKDRQHRKPNTDISNFVKAEQKIVNKRGGQQTPKKQEEKKARSETYRKGISKEDEKPSIKIFTQLEKAAALVIQKAMKRYMLKVKWRRSELELTKLQASIKGTLLRRKLRLKMRSQKEYLKMERAAATKVQATYRMHVVHKSYKRVLRAVVTIQRWIKRIQLGTKLRTEFIEKRIAAVKIQSWYRGSVACRRYRKLRSIVLNIQACTRNRMQLLHKRQKAAVILQSHFRSLLQGRKDRQNYLKLKSSTVILQSYYRMYVKRRCYTKLKHAVLIIQRYWRNHLIAKRFNTMKLSAMKIQKWYRGMKEKQKRESAATVIQKFWNGYQCRKNLQKLEASAIIIQTCYRSYICRKTYISMINSAVIIQAGYRSYCCYKWFNEMKSASVSIQKNYRGYVCRKRYGQMRNAAVTIQSWYRSWLECKKCRSAFLKAKMAVQCLQFNWRSYKWRKEMERQKKAACVIQSTFRMLEARKNFLKQKAAVYVIEEFWSSAVLTLQMRQDFQRKRNACICIQAFVRCAQMRNGYLLSRNACICIQSCVRGWLQRRRYVKIHSSVIRIQAWSRCVLIRRKYLKLKNATTCIQQYYRCTKLKNQQYTNYHIQRGAAIALQNHFRQFLASKGFYERKVNKSNDTSFSKSLTLIENRQHHLVRGAAITIQACVRGWIARRQVQDIWLRKQLCEPYDTPHPLSDRESSSLSDQNRGHETDSENSYHREVHRQTCSNSSGKTFSRCSILGLEPEIEHCKRNISCSSIEEASDIRCSQTALVQNNSNNLSSVYDSVEEGTSPEDVNKCCLKAENVTCQDLRWSKLPTIEVTYAETDKNTSLDSDDCIFVDSLEVCSNRFHKQMFSDDSYDSFVDSLDVCDCHPRDEFDDYSLGVLDKGRTVGVVEVFDTRQLKAAVIIQKFYRSYRDRKAFLALKIAAMTLQHHWRARMKQKLLKKRQLNHHDMVEVALQVLQARLKYKSLKKNTSTVQDWFEMAHAKATYHDTVTHAETMLSQHKRLQAAEKIKRWYQERKAKINRELQRKEQLKAIAAYTLFHLSAIRIQRAYRKHRILIQKANAVKIQSNWWTMWLNLPSPKKHFKLTLRWMNNTYWQMMGYWHEIAVDVQELWYLALRWRYEMAAWRGYAVRSKRESENFQQLVAIRAQLRTSTRNSIPENTIHSRTVQALQALVGLRDFKNASEPLRILALSTSVSVACCQLVVQMKVIPALHKLLLGCGRCQIQVKRSACVIAILNSVAKHSNLRSAIWKEPKILNTLSSYLKLQGKTDKLFVDCCLLLRVLVQDAPCRKMMQRNFTITGQLKSLHLLLLRKVRLLRPDPKTNKLNKNASSMIQLHEAMSSILDLLKIK